MYTYRYCVLIGSVQSTVDGVASSINASAVLTQTENLGSSKFTSNIFKSPRPKILHKQWHYNFSPFEKISTSMQSKNMNGKSYTFYLDLRWSFCSKDTLSLFIPCSICNIISSNGFHLQSTVQAENSQFIQLQCYNCLSTR